jgi:hypothetical protein
MARSIVLFVLSWVCHSVVYANRVTGSVRDDKGNVLPYASVLVKGTTRGVTAGSDGRYSIALSSGDYTLVCQYVGYGRQEKKISVRDSALVVDFSLSPQQLSMAAVVVRPGGEDPAYAIIRHAIKRRRDYEAPLDSFSCEVYIKTLMKTRHLPDRILGQKVEQQDKKDMGVDSAGKGIIFLSESLTKVFFRRPNKIKMEVLSGRQSGSNGYGFTLPTFINFYDNNVAVLGNLSPRGFVSPIADGALGYYRYKFLGSWFEDGKEINEIQVIPRRKFEPLFSGKIDIVEGDWRIHSLDLLLVKESQLQLLDTLEIKQLHAPVTGGGGGSAGSGSGGDVWQVKNQVVYFTFNILGVDAVGNFLNIYNNYDIQPKFKRKFFNNVLIRYDTAGNKRTRTYWDSIRPLPLEPDEKINYTIRDSIYRYNPDSMGTRKNRDSLLRKQGHIKAMDFLTGFNRSNFRAPAPLRYSLSPLFSGFHYNTVEGINWTVSGSVSKRLGGLGELELAPHIRYGFHNTRLNPWGILTLRRRKFVREEESISSSRQTWTLAGGKRVEQFDASEPISETVNDAYTLLGGDNFLKEYEKYFVQLGSDTRWDNGLRMSVRAGWEDRIPVSNTTLYTWASTAKQSFTPNYPVERLDTSFPRHRAVVTSVELEYQPGRHFIEFPDRKVSLGSKYPTLSLRYTKGWDGVMGSSVNFDKWQFSVRDDINLKLLGQFKYRLVAGGFLNTGAVYLQDYAHFNGNQTIVAGDYLHSLQMAPYYAYSNTASLYGAGYTEHHFNGLLTNKIPLFRRLNWNLVGGFNVFYANGASNFEEMSWGLENIFKIFRVDILTSWREGSYFQTGVRIGMGGLLGDGMRRAPASGGR